MRILVTGGAGFIGSNFARFVAHGHHFVIAKPDGAHRTHARI